MKPKNLILHNFLSHEHTNLDFTKLDKVNLVVGMINNNPSTSNGAGKTAIIEGVLYALFEKSRVSENKNVTLRDLVRHNSDGKMYVEFIFELNGVEYKITRTRDNNKNKGTCDFQVKDNGKWKSKKGSKKGSTNKEILETIKIDYKTFTASICFQQGEVDKFVEASGTERKEIIKNILQLDRYAKYQASAKAKLSIIKDELKVIDKYLENHFVNPTDLEEKEVDYKKAKERQRIYTLERDNVYKQLEKLREKQILYNDKVENKKNLKSRIKSTQETIDKGIEKQESAEKKKQTYLKLFEDKKKEFTQLEEEYKQLKDKFIVKKEELIKQGKKANNSLKDAEEKYEKSQGICFSIKGQIENVEKDLTGIQNLEENSRCPTCKSNITRSSKESAEQVLNDLKQTLSNRLLDAEKNMKTDKATVERFRKDVEEIKEKVTEYNQWTKEKNHLKKQLSGLKEAGLQAQTILKDQESIITESQSIIKQYEAELQQLKEQYEKIDVDTEYFEKLNREIHEKNKQYEESNRLLTQSTLSTGRLESEIEGIKKTLKESEEYTAQRKNLLREQTYYTQLTDMFGKEIPTLIIENSCAELEREANEILSAISNLSIEMKTQQKTLKGDLKETFEIYVRKPTSSEFLFIDNLSNGEKFRVVFAIRIALSRLLTRRRGSAPIEFLFYDECFGSLDEYGVDQIIDIFAYLKKDFEYQLVITHRADLKDRFGSNVIQIQSEDGKSRILQGRK